MWAVFQLVSSSLIHNVKSYQIFRDIHIELFQRIYRNTLSVSSIFVFSNMEPLLILSFRFFQHRFNRILETYWKMSNLTCVNYDMVTCLKWKLHLVFRIPHIDLAPANVQGLFQWSWVTFVFFHYVLWCTVKVNTEVANLKLFSSFTGIRITKNTRNTVNTIIRSLIHVPRFRLTNKRVQDIFTFENGGNIVMIPDSLYFMILWKKGMSLLLPLYVCNSFIDEMVWILNIIFEEELSHIKLWWQPLLYLTDNWTESFDIYLYVLAFYISLCCNNCLTSKSENEETETCVLVLSLMWISLNVLVC